MMSIANCNLILQSGDFDLIEHGQFRRQCWLRVQDIMQQGIGRVGCKMVCILMAQCVHWLSIEIQCNFYHETWIAKFTKIVAKHTKACCFSLQSMFTSDIKCVIVMKTSTHAIIVHIYVFYMYRWLYVVNLSVFVFCSIVSILLLLSDTLYVILNEITPSSGISFCFLPLAVGIILMPFTFAGTPNDIW